MKILGLDVGEKRIGIAKVDSNTKIAIPVGFLDNDGEFWERLASLGRLNSTNWFVLGLPRSNEGNETKQTLFVRQFARTLLEQIPGAKVRFQDESLTSVEAEERLKKRKKKYERGEIDAEAATIILQDFIETFDARETKVPKKSNTVKTSSSSKSTGSGAGARTSTKARASTGASASTDTEPTSFKKVSEMQDVLNSFVNDTPIISPVVSSAKKGASKVKDEAVRMNLKTRKVKNKVKGEVKGDMRKLKIIISALTVVAIIAGAAFGVIMAIKAQRAKEREEYYQKLEAEMEPEVFTFTIAPGETIFDVKKNLSAVGYSAEDIEAGFNAEYDFDFLASRPAGASLEGYLFGETHEFYKTATVKDVLTKFLEGTGAIISSNDLVNRYSARGLSLHEGITLASVVQKESMPGEMATVAQVFLTRLSYGWVLGSDVTVSYALDILDPNREYYTDNSYALTIDSCYNTRLYGGLPCGPISNPGLAALLAVAEPSDTSYLYFLTGDDGVMYYSYTEAEHNQNAYLHCQTLCNVSL